MSKRIALIHATPVAMQPVVEAFRCHWPDVDTFSVLDDALSIDLARSGTLNEALKQRVASLAAYATFRHLRALPAHRRATPRSRADTPA